MPRCSSPSTAELYGPSPSPFTAIVWPRSAATDRTPGAPTSQRTPRLTVTPTSRTGIPASALRTEPLDCAW